MTAFILPLLVSCQPLVTEHEKPPTTTVETATTVTTTQTSTTTTTTTTTGETKTVKPEILPTIDYSDLLFDDHALPEFHITLSPASFSALESDPYTYVEGTFTFKDETFENVGVRTKGQNSWRPINEKPSLKVKLDWKEDQKLYGLEEITLNAMNDDSTMMHERLAYRFYREAGIPAARATHAWVVINDEPYGLYTHIETVDRDFIRRRLSLIHI